VFKSITAKSIFLVLIFFSQIPAVAISQRKAAFKVKTVRCSTVIPSSYQTLNLNYFSHDNQQKMIAFSRLYKNECLLIKLYQPDDGYYSIDSNGIRLSTDAEIFQLDRP
jgi:hypothetical protein